MHLLRFQNRSNYIYVKELFVFRLKNVLFWCFDVESSFRASVTICGPNTERELQRKVY